MNDLATACIKAAERAKDRGDWFMFVEHRKVADNDGGVNAINSIPLIVSDAAYQEIIRQAWTWSNCICKHREKWNAILRGTRRVLPAFSLPKDRIALTSMSDPVAIYRGCCEHNKEGFSWTLDPERAEYFACFTQGHTKARQRFVLSGTVVQKDVLAYLTTRNEEEIVVLPENVTNTKAENISSRPIIKECDMKRLNKAPK